MSSDALFDVSTPLGFSVHVTHNYWELIVTIKHPAMQGRQLDVQEALQAPDQIRRSRSDPTVYLFYRLQRPGRWTCAVAKRLDGDGFLITTYPTESIKEGEQVWSR
jgi:hypothetical protein